MHELLRFAKLLSGISEPPFGGLRGKVGALSIPRWKLRDRLPIRRKMATKYKWMHTNLVITYHILLDTNDTNVYIASHMGTIIFLPATLPNVDRLSKFFHWQTHSKFAITSSLPRWRHSRHSEIPCHFHDNSRVCGTHTHIYIYIIIWDLNGCHTLRAHNKTQDSWLVSTPHHSMWKFSDRPCFLLQAPVVRTMSQPGRPVWITQPVIAEHCLSY